jgi:hypothetical protein
MIELPVIRFTRKSVRQTALAGIALIAAGFAWIAGATALDVPVDGAGFWIGFVPFVLLLLAGVILLAAWVWFFTFRLLGLTGMDDGAES